MAKLLLNVLKLSPVVFAATLFVSNGAFAAEQKFTSVDELAQVTSVSQLSDVQPSDWAFQAVQSLVERYGCIAGYPDGTFKGNRAMTRYEFAAGLNACLERITQLIAASGNGTDMETVKKLRNEFEAELETLRGRVDGLEYRTAELEDNQFSTTTKLKGEAIFAVSGATGDSSVDDNIVLSNRVRLNFDSSFTGKDRLRVRLQANNTPEFNDATGTRMARLGFDGADDNEIQLGELNYTFKPSKGIKVKIDAFDADANDNVNVFNPMLKSSGSGAISRYGRFSPIYRVASRDAGATVTFGTKKSPLKVSLAYNSDSNNNPGVDDDGNAQGLFTNNTAYLGQVEFKPSKKLNLGLTYVRTSERTGDVNLTGSTGSGNARRPFGNVATNANHYGLQASYKLSKKTVLSGWYGFADASREDGTSGSADINYWGATLGIKDVGAKGNTLGIIFGQPPKLTGGSGVTADSGTSYHLEGLYKMKVNDRIAITPGILAVFNPEHNSSNDTVYVGTIRTTFKF